MASFVPFLVYFMLSWRDHIGKSVLRLFHGQDRYTVGKTWSGIGDSTRAYVLGNFLLWVFLSSVSAIAFFFLGVPYWLLIGPLSAFFSLLPYVGLPLSIVPPLLAAVAIPNRIQIILTLVLDHRWPALHRDEFHVPKDHWKTSALESAGSDCRVDVLERHLGWNSDCFWQCPLPPPSKPSATTWSRFEPYGKLLGD